MPVTLLWLTVQLVGYCAAFLAIVLAAFGLILAPPFFAGRFVWRHFHA